ncbi:hypothetical protein BJ742DRAFT_795755 [Cladochytrium replicatum]|nr:hypothetical protein BJ742DRAFT_795755 [Cladochytrium replicatum]
MSIPQHQIRAVFNESTVRVYQAYNASIAGFAAQNQFFPSTFSVTRMTWIKPSFCWMAYRAGYSYKDRNQERILAIDLKREAFDALLEEAVLAKEQIDGASHEVVVQWDPERNELLEKLQYRSIQIGIRGEKSRLYAEGMLSERIEDVTDQFRAVHRLAFEVGDVDGAKGLLPAEMEYPASQTVRRTLHMEQI